MTQAEALYYLQETELDILRTQKRLDEIARLLTDNAALAEAQQRVDEAAKALAPVRARARNLDLEMQTNAQKATSTEEQLYSGSVKNPKAMQDMQQEIEALKQWQSTLEERMLEAMVEQETAEKALSDAEAYLAEARATFEIQHAGLLTEQQALSEKLEKLQVQRQAALKPVAPENLKTYAGMKRSKNNQPMSLLVEQGCTFCGVEQTMNIVHEARRSETLVTCLNCGRILVYRS